MFKEKTPEEIAALNPEELKTYNAEKKAHDAKVAKVAKETKNADKSAGAVKDFYDKKGAETLENYQKGGSATNVNLTNKTSVEFTEDFGFFKKGHVQEVSDVAFAIYESKNVVKKL